jgi:hypothetical protein
MIIEIPPIDLIATFTDFGVTGPYLGQMSAVLATQAPKIPRVTLMADAPKFDPQSAGLLLSFLCKDLPPQTLILAVVDPGVGGNRRPLMIKTDKHLFVGPDNGLFLPIIRRSGECEIETIEWRPHRLSDTFHGRDLFAPVAAKLATGKAVEGCRIPPQEMVGFGLPIQDNRIIYIDSYGNAMTAIDAADIGKEAVLSVNGSALHFARTFSEVPEGQPFWYGNSMGMVEIAVNCGSAADLLGLELGVSVQL